MEILSIFPINILKIVSLLFLSILLGIASSGGLGGGLIASPFFMFFFDFPTKQSTQIAQIFIFFGGLGSYLQNCSIQHPIKKNQSLINYEFAMAGLPGVIFGTILGYIVNQIVYDIILIITLLFFCSMALYKNVLKVKEIVQKQKLPQQTESLINSNINLNGINSVDNKNEIVNKIELKYIIEKLKYLIALSVLGLLMILIKGSKQVNSIIGIKQCSWMYYIIIVLIGLVFYSVFLEIKKKLIREQIIDVSKQNINRDALNGVIAGFIGGLIGIGGGVILTAQMLQQGYHPQEITSTSSLIVMFNGFINIFQVILGTGYFFKDFLYLSILSLVSAFFVQKFFNALSKKFDNPAITLYCLCFVLFDSIFVVFYTSFLRIFKDPSSLFVSSSIC